MANIYYQQDCDLSKLNGKTVAIIGYGSQGHAHALNLKESGVNVIVGLYNGSKSWAKAEAQGLKVMTAAEAAAAADLIMILINDEKQAKLYKESIEPNLTEGKTLAFAHGFNMIYSNLGQKLSATRSTAAALWAVVWQSKSKTAIPQSLPSIKNGAMKENQKHSLDVPSS